MNEQIVEAALRHNGFAVSHFEDRKEATAYLAEQIQGKTVGFGGSMTVKEMGLDQALAKNNKLYWHWNQEQVKELGGMEEVRKQANQAQVYICSVNGMSETGELVNIDGSGNRIAATAYGHEAVYFVVGVNKVAKDLAGAIDRAKNVAAPKNAQRLNRKTPCAQHADKCYNCNSPERICNGTLILERPMGQMKMEVVLVDEELGM